MKYKIEVYFLDEEEPRIYSLKTKDQVIEVLIGLSYVGIVEQINYEKVK